MLGSGKNVFDEDVLSEAGSDICDCHEKEQRAMEKKRNDHVEGEDPPATDDEDEGEAEMWEMYRWVVQ